MLNGRFAFSSPLWGGGGLGATHDDHLRLIRIRVVDFLLALIELFRSVLRLRRYERIGSKSAILLQRGPVDQKFQVEGVARTKHFSYHKTRLNGHFRMV